MGRSSAITRIDSVRAGTLVGCAVNRNHKVARESDAANTAPTIAVLEELK